MPTDGTEGKRVLAPARAPARRHSTCRVPASLLRLTGEGPGPPTHPDPGDKRQPFLYTQKVPPEN